MMFSQLRLTVPDITAVTQFYRDILGMTDQRDGLGYGGQQVHLEFIQGSAQPPTADCFFLENWHYCAQSGHGRHALAPKWRVDLATASI